ncbi:MAG: hypothetical protein VYB54_02390 [Pseudomonadota bacterium]|nr:hypothetical protein [Pseudomonadota bacterium]
MTFKIRSLAALGLAGLLAACAPAAKPVAVVVPPPAPPAPPPVDHNQTGTFTAAEAFCPPPLWLSVVHPGGRDDRVIEVFSHDFTTMASVEYGEGAKQLPFRRLYAFVATPKECAEDWTIYAEVSDGARATVFKGVLTPTGFFVEKFLPASLDYATARADFVNGWKRVAPKVGTLVSYDQGQNFKYRSLIDDVDPAQRLLAKVILEAVASQVQVEMATRVAAQSN